MRPSSAIVISLAATLLLSTALLFVFNGKILGVLLLLPLGFISHLVRKKPKPPTTPGNTAKPIEPE
jgi:hypothetical protein